MPPLDVSVAHGQTWDVARVNFEEGIRQARAKFGLWIRHVDWSPDRTAARLSGPGFAVEMRVDAREVHARGDLPAFAKFFEAPLRAFLRQTFHGPSPK